MTETPMISAHRSGAENDLARENKLETLHRAAELGCDFIEFDVHATADGHFVLNHDEFIREGALTHQLREMTLSRIRELLPDVTTLAECLDAIKGHANAHVDLKFTSPEDAYHHPESTLEVRATEVVLQEMGADGCIITTLEDRSVLAVRDWADSMGINLLVGLSLGRDLSGAGAVQKLKVRLSELFPAQRIRNCRANLLVANKDLARLTLHRFAARRGIPLLVWTVDEEADLTFWLGKPDTWLVTTNFPKRALRLRHEAAGG